MEQRQAVLHEAASHRSPVLPLDVTYRPNPLDREVLGRNGDTFPRCSSHGENKISRCRTPGGIFYVDPNCVGAEGDLRILDSETLPRVLDVGLDPCGKVNGRFLYVEQSQRIKIN